MTAVAAALPHIDRLVSEIAFDGETLWLKQSIGDWTRTETHKQYITLSDD